MDRRARQIQRLGLRRGADQVLVVAGLEFVRILVQAFQVGHAVITGAGLEDIVERQRAQRRQAAGAAAADDQALTIGQAAFDQVARAGDAIIDIDDAPLALERVAISPAEAAAAAVIDVQHAEAAAGPVLGRQLQCIARHAGRTAVADHDHRRQAVGIHVDIVVFRRVEKGLCDAPAAAGKADAVRDRQVFFIGHVIDRARQHRQCAAGQIDGRQFQRQRRRTAQQRDKAGADPQLADFLVRVDDRRQCSGMQARQLADALLNVGADDVAVCAKTVHRHAEGPVRRREFGLHRTQRIDAAIGKAIQIPPATAVGNEMQYALRRPLRLANRDVAAAGDLARRTQAAVNAHVGQPQLGALPRHLRMIPAQPCQLRTVRRQARRGVKIVTFDQHCYLAVGAVDIDRAKHVLRVVMARVRMQLAHADQALAPLVDDEIGPAPAVRWRQWRSHCAIALQIDPVVRKV